LRHYFQAHKNQSTNKLSSERSFAKLQIIWKIGKMGSRAVSALHQIQKRTSIKSQVLADFVADWTLSQNQSNNKKQPDWIIYCDGAWGFAGAGVAAIITSPSRVKMKYAARLEFQCTSNIAEYETVLLRL
jgi:hypothetical protein